MDWVIGVMEGLGGRYQPALMEPGFFHWQRAMEEIVMMRTLFLSKEKELCSI